MCPEGESGVRGRGSALYKRVVKGLYNDLLQYGVGRKLKRLLVGSGKLGEEASEVHNRYITTRSYSKATPSVNFRAVGEELFEICDFLQTYIYVFIYIDCVCVFVCVCYKFIFILYWVIFNYLTCSVFRVGVQLYVVLIYLL